MVVNMTYMAFSLSGLLNFDDKISNSLSFSEKLGNILTTAIGGYLLVFVVLGIIWLLLEIFGKFVFRNKKSEKPVVSEPITAPDAEEEPVNDDLETVAAITAAISAYENKPIGSFKVVSFRKKN